jgi:hypothetical protein
MAEKWSLGSISNREDEKSGLLRQAFSSRPGTGRDILVNHGTLDRASELSTLSSLQLPDET